MGRDHAIELAGETVVLRPFRAADVDLLHAAVRESMPELTRWLSWCHADYAIEDARAFLDARGGAYERDGECAFAIDERTTGRLLGGTGLNLIDRAALRANLGYWLRTSATGHGFATEAVRLLARWALVDSDFERIEIVAAEGNLASQRVAERAGATRETLARKRLRVHGVQQDAYVFSLVRDDFR